MIGYFFALAYTEMFYYKKVKRQLKSESFFDINETTISMYTVISNHK